MFVVAVGRAVSRSCDIRASVLFSPQSARLNGDRFNMVCRFSHARKTSPEGGRKFYHVNENTLARSFARERTSDISLRKNEGRATQ